MAPADAIDQDLERERIVASLTRMGLLGDGARCTLTALAGGVSSDIYKVEPEGGEPFCIKRALAKLKVAAEWRAPVERNHAEAEWMRLAEEILPGCVPPILGEDRAFGLFAMAYLPPESYPVWKARLRDGEADLATADRVGAALASIHSATAGDAEIAAAFANDETFYAIRLEPYLIAAGRAHPHLAGPLTRLAERTAKTKLALVHGDVSPKNILVGPDGPVFLDAECAWYGDPAFDAAFCLNHLLLKCLWRPQLAGEYLMAFEGLVGDYLRYADWEPKEELDARIAALLPGLMLARVDGKSPVEYLTEESQKEKVRRFARPFIGIAPESSHRIWRAWEREVL